MNLRGTAAKIAVSVSALAMVAQAPLAAAQPAPPPDGYQDQPPPPPGYQPPPPPPDYQNEPAPPQGQYAPPPGSQPPPPAYDDRAQNYDRDYAQRYSAWAARYCVDRRNNNVAAGAIIGGILGAVIGGGLAGRYDRGAGVVVGGGLGATAGAAVGASSSDSANCPPGYMVSAGAPAFVYDGPYAPYYGPGVVYGPGWYQPWVFVGGQWTYRPYRSWYYGHRGYWRPGDRHRY